MRAHHWLHFALALALGGTAFAADPAPPALPPSAEDEPADLQVIASSLSLISTHHVHAIGDDALDRLTADAIASANGIVSFDACPVKTATAPAFAKWPMTWRAAMCAEQVDPKDRVRHGWVGRTLDAIMLVVDKEGSVGRQSEMQVHGEDALAGVGVTFATASEGVRIVALRRDSPLSAHGVNKGDLIVAVDGKSLAGLGLEEAVALLRGDAGSGITLIVKREGTPERALSVKRQFFDAEGPELQQMGRVAVITLPSFTYGLGEALMKTLNAAPVRQADAILLDLRGNEGGLLDETVLIADRFLKKGEVFAMQARNKWESERFSARGKDDANGKPLFVLIDDKTASGPEMVAAALQDAKRATIMGEVSYKRGSIQTLFALDRQFYLRLTTAQVIRPNGAMISGLGVTPDVALTDVPKARWLAEAVARIEARLPAKR